jgi:hypothetical protein
MKRDFSPSILVGGGFISGALWAADIGLWSLLSWPVLLALLFWWTAIRAERNPK